MNDNNVNKNIIHSVTPSEIVKELLCYTSIYKDNECHPLLDLSTFKPTLEWANDLNELYITNEVTTKWRAIIDIENISPDIIDILSKSGLKLINIQTLSVSTTQLNQITIVKNADEYIGKLNEVISISMESGVWIALNILLYPTEETTIETREWLLQNKEFIKTVSFNPPAHVEDDLSIIGKSINQSIEFSKLITTDSDYFDLKKFEHFKSNYSYKDFIEDISNIDQKSLPFITPWEEKEIHKERIVIFGGMGTGKSLLTEMIEEELQLNGFEVHSHNIGDTCRFFMKVGNVNPYWKNKTRSLGQQIASKLREVDKDLLNEIVLADIHNINSNLTSNDTCAHIVTGGRTLEDFKYWNDHNFLTIGVVSDREETASRLKTRDEGQIQNESNLQHETEINTDFISRRLCKVLVENNGTIEELRDKAKDIVRAYILTK